MIQDFLRNIPGSLLSSDLYELWMGAMDGPIEGEESQLEAIQRYSDKQTMPSITLKITAVIAVQAT